MSDTPKFQFRNRNLFFLVWYVCTQSTYMRIILTVLVKKCTIDVDLYGKFTSYRFFLNFKNRISNIHIFSICTNNIIVLYMYLNGRVCFTRTCNFNFNWSVRSLNLIFRKGSFSTETSIVMRLLAKKVVQMLQTKS